VRGLTPSLSGAMSYQRLVVPSPSLHGEPYVTTMIRIYLQGHDVSIPTATAAAYVDNTASQPYSECTVPRGCSSALG
jgi:hypothetical protein